jgi:hypothetical protein
MSATVARPTACWLGLGLFRRSTGAIFIFGSMPIIRLVLSTTLPKTAQALCEESGLVAVASFTSGEILLMTTDL